MWIPARNRSHYFQKNKTIRSCLILGSPWTSSWTPSCFRVSVCGYFCTWTDSRCCAAQLANYIAKYYIYSSLTPAHCPREEGGMQDLTTNQNTAPRLVASRARVMIFYVFFLIIQVPFSKWFKQKLHSKCILNINYYFLNASYGKIKCNT